MKKKIKPDGQNLLQRFHHIQRPSIRTLRLVFAEILTVGAQIAVRPDRRRRTAGVQIVAVHLLRDQHVGARLPASWQSGRLTIQLNRHPWYSSKFSVKERIRRRRKRKRRRRKEKGGVGLNYLLPAHINIFVVLINQQVMGGIN